jgi:hypothetical protein
VFLASPGATAATIAIAIERIIKVYKDLVEIRVAHATLEEKGLSDESLAGVRREADMHMEQGIGVLVDELMDRHAGDFDPNREHELRTELTFSLRQLAKRIDAGYQVEVRVGLPERADDEELAEADKIPEEDRRAQEDIANAQEGLRFMELEGPPILSLEEPEGEPEAEATAE